MPYLLLGAEQPKDYEAFMLECLEAIQEHRIKGIALVALTEGEDEDTLTAFWKMGPVERAYAATHLQFDAVDAFILANIGRYATAGEEERESET